MNIYFTIQFKRLGRAVRDFGLPPALGFVLFAGLFLGGSWFFFQRAAYAELIYPLIAFAVVSRLGTLQRNEFLQHTYPPKKYRQLRLLENLMVALPFFGFMLFEMQWLPALSILPGAALLSLYNKVNRSRFVLPTPFSKRPFEYPIGFRKLCFLYIVTAILMYISIAYENFNIGGFGLIGTFLVNMNYYAKAEPEFFVWIHAQSPDEFLKQKIGTSLLYGMLLSIPYVLALLIFFPLKGHYIALLELVGALYLIAGALAKYNNYPDQLSLTQTIILSFCIVIPPGLLLLIPLYFREAKKKLSPYLQ